MLTKHASILRSSLAFGLALVACKGAERPHVPSAGSQTLSVGRSGFSLRGVASDGASTYAALTSSGLPHTSVIEARRGSAITWTAKPAGMIGPLAIVGPLLVGSVEGTGQVAVGPPVELRGDPAAIIAAYDRATGALRWRLAVDSTEWALVSSVTAIGNDLLVGGSFGGTLRIGAKVVSSAGGSDGFLARVTPAGQLVWIVRLGGAGADSVQGVAATATRIAIAGTVTSGAEIHGAALPPIDERLPYGDAFVAELDGNGARTWSATFGSRADDAVAGVAIDASGRIAVAASVHDVVRVGSATLTARGTGDGLVVWYGEGGEIGATTLVGGSDFDGLRAIAAVGNRIVVGGFYSGTLELAGEKLTAGGGDDAFLAALDASGTVATAWHVGGAGREEITSLSALPGGFIAGVAHTAAATIDDDTLAAPADPASGAAIVVRGN